MLTVNIPDSLNAYCQISQQDISFVHYQEATPAGRNLISFTRCAISFVLSGQKEFFRDSANVLMHSGQGIVIPQGNAIIAERGLDASGYSSLVVFFPLSAVAQFTRSSAVMLSRATSVATAPRGFLPFELTPYLSAYIKNLMDLIHQQAVLTYPMMLHKLRELFLVLAEMHPAAFKGLWNSSQNASELRLRTLIESNIIKGFTLEELAFLANRSLASFKRDFEKVYGTSPGKYLMKRKMEIACHMLQCGKSPIEAAEETGYENLSNFAAAFKKWTGHTPKVYQSTGLPIEPLIA